MLGLGIVLGLDQGKGYKQEVHRRNLLLVVAC